MHPVTLAIEATCGAARAGVAATARGTYRTPCFMPVGTRGAVKYLSAADYEALGVEIVLANTYHLMLRPGAEVVAGAGGLGAFSGWDGLTLTDSGGFQVFSLEPTVDDEGVTFRSVYDGSVHRLTPESAVHTQELLGADIQMALDVCPPLPSPAEVVRLAVDRTLALGEPGPRRSSTAPASRSSESSRAAPTRRSAPRAPSARSSWTSTATPSGDCRWGRRRRRCCRHSRRPSPTFPPTALATSWGWATRRPSSRPSPSAPTSSTA